MQSVCSPSTYAVVPLYVERSKKMLLLKLSTVFLHAEYQECPSSEGPPTREWVLTDAAEGNQLGTEQRVREKEALLGMHSLRIV